MEQILNNFFGAFGLVSIFLIFLLVVWVASTLIKNALLKPTADIKVGKSKELKLDKSFAYINISKATGPNPFLVVQGTVSSHIIGIVSTIDGQVPCETGTYELLTDDHPNPRYVLTLEVMTEHLVRASLNYAQAKTETQNR